MSYSLASKHWLPSQSIILEIWGDFTRKIWNCENIFQAQLHRLSEKSYQSQLVPSCDAHCALIPEFPASILYRNVIQNPITVSKTSSMSPGDDVTFYLQKTNHITDSQSWREWWLQNPCLYSHYSCITRHWLQQEMYSVNTATGLLLPAN